MEIKIVKGEKSVEFQRVKKNANSKNLSVSPDAPVRGMSIGKITHGAIEKFGGMEKIVKRLKKVYPKLTITLVDPNQPAPEPAPAPAPEPAPAPSNG